jgi:hypothetical protein
MKIFLSHSSTDKKIVREISSQLKLEGLGAWIDECEISYGDSLVKKISESIDSVSYVLAFLSRESVISDWVKFELELASTGEIQGKSLIVIPVLLEACEIPPYLRHKVYCDLSNKSTGDKNLQILIGQLKGESELPEPVDLKYDKPDKSFDGYIIGLTGVTALLFFVFQSDIPSGKILFNYSFLWFILCLGGHYSHLAGRRILLECRKTIPNFGKAVSTFQLYGFLRPSYLITVLTFYRFQLVKIYLIFSVIDMVVLAFSFYFGWKILSLMIL